MVRTFHHRDFPAERLAVEREETVSVVVPTRNCAATIGPIASTLARLVDESSLEGASEAVRSSLTRSAGAHAELAGARASIDKARFFATETDVSTTR